VFSEDKFAEISNRLNIPLKNLLDHWIGDLNLKFQASWIKCMLFPRGKECVCNKKDHFQHLLQSEWVLQIMYRSITLCCISNCIYSHQHIICTDIHYTLSTTCFGPFGHHQVCIFTAGCTANPLHWSMFTQCTYTLFCWITGVVLIEINTTEHVLKSSIFWDKTPCSLLKIKWRFGGTRRLHLQDQRLGQARNQGESRWQPECILFVICSLMGLLTALQVWTEQKELTWAACLFSIGLTKQSAVDSQINFIYTV
jgi:hypothetical protein